MSDITPSWTEVSLLAPTLINQGGWYSSSVLNLTAKFGAYIFVQIGKTNSNSFAPTGVEVSIRRILNAALYPAPVVTLRTTTIAGWNSVTTAFDTTQEAINGSYYIPMSNTANFVIGDIVSVCNTAADATNLEFFKITDMDSVKLYTNKKTTKSHPNNSIIVNNASVFAPVWVPGGASYEVFIDYTYRTGDPIAVQVFAQTHDKYVAT